MKLFGYQIIAKVEDHDEPVEVTIMDKYRRYWNGANYDVYLCKDESGDTYTIEPRDIISFK